MEKACCGFGHRFVWENIAPALKKEIEQAVREGCRIFYTGAQGEFDKLFTEAVRAVKAENRHLPLRLICVKPYYTKALQENREYYETKFDEVLIPSALDDMHYKAAIPARNKWMIDKSDIVITYTVREYGGAYQALCYARKHGKEIWQI
ncbi:MAG: DUF1273 domain-containing protein [Clostridia bacterium]|nr:DUF1273 domain-containing protein [Clostridia bacterium]